MKNTNSEKLDTNSPLSTEDKPTNNMEDKRVSASSPSHAMDTDPAGTCSLAIDSPGSPNNGSDDIASGLPSPMHHSSEDKPDKLPIVSNEHKDETPGEESRSLLSRDCNHGNQDEDRSCPKQNNGVHETVIVLCDDQSPKCSKHNRTSDTYCCPRNVHNCVKKNECLVLCVASVTFLFGCLALAVAVYLMKTGGKCQENGDSAKPINSSSTSPSFKTNVTQLFPDLAYRGPGVAISYNITVVSEADRNDTAELVEDHKDHKPVNLAAGRQAYQSSTILDQYTSYPASLAVDNSPDFLFSTGSCSRTNTEEQPYWYVDLGGLEMVKKVTLMIPRDLPGELHNFEIRIGQETHLELNPLCRYYMGTALISTIQIHCERPMYGRYLSIKMLGDETRPLNRLTLCEVMVFNA